MRKLKPLAVGCAVISLTVALAPAVSAKPVSKPSSVAASPGSTGAGDPYFPLQGNGGYQAVNYNLDVSYQPSSQLLSGTAVIAARATQNLSRFDLDLRRNLVVSSVTVNGRRATFAQPAALEQELVITPATALRNGQQFVVRVRYAGHAVEVTDPDGSPDGFIPTSDGAFVASEPQGAPSWFPANDTPTDKATFEVSIAVPAGLTAVSNGTRIANWTARGQAHSTWLMSSPISTYLVTATIGKFAVSTGRTKSGIPYLNAVEPSQAAESKPVLAKLPSIVDYFSSVYGPYPFKSTGAIIDYAPEVGYALETATRPLFDQAPDIQTLSHELAHQWFGDSVTLSDWQDIWLNEGFAEFSSWLWDEHAGIETGAEHLQALLAEPADSDVWDPPPSNPGSAADIFDSSIYERGAGALQTLRELVGDRSFFQIMRGWATTHRGGNATIDEFRAFAAKVSHRNLDTFFETWLDQPGKPGS